MKFFNTLTKEIEPLQTLEPSHLKMYVCGPTVYDRPHLGNARCVVVYDLLFRFFLQVFPRVTYVRNITDVDDKINAAAKEQKISIQQLTQKITDFFHADTDALNVLRPTFEPRATTHIPEMIEMIEKLIAQNHAYVAGGHVLFDVASFADYGKLANRNLEEMLAGARVEIASYKKNPLDFVLWKPADEDDDISSVFESPWGKGRPGWHIECSAMSSKYLGADFDIHGGGRDLQFPHHENEIAQSRCAHAGSGYARFWIHNGFLTVNGEKMSKSLKNFVTVRDLLDKKISGTVIRCMLLATHYRKPFDFNEKALLDAQMTVEKFNSVIQQDVRRQAQSADLLLDWSNTLRQVQGDEVCDAKGSSVALRQAQGDGNHNFEDGVTLSLSKGDRANDTSNSHTQGNQNSLLKKILNHLADDLNISKTFALLHETVKEIKSKKDENLRSEFTQALDFLGLIELQKNKTSSINEEEILTQINLRLKAKQEKNFTKADEIRNSLLAQGVVLEDVAGGKTIWKKN